MDATADSPLGVFDSGIGGLTVLAALRRRLPDEAALYLGDTARVPYGTKSGRVVTRYAANNAAFLAARGIKLLVVACNTASAVALPALEQQLAVPVVGVIAPGARRALARSRSRRIGVIGTEGTVASGAYERALRRLDPAVVVRSRACPLFVPLAEEGWGDHPVADEVARSYLAGWTAEEELDCLILGCTHYPLLVPAIRRAVGPAVALIDSAAAAAEAVAERLAAAGLARGAGAAPPRQRFFVTDVPERFAQVGARFLGEPLQRVQQVDLEPGRVEGKAE
jgi:glutamate racemase